MERRMVLSLVVACALAGCESAGPRDRLDQDPLLVSRRPVERKPSAVSPPEVVARAEPAAPSLPAAVLASAPKTLGSDWGDRMAAASPVADEPEHQAPRQDRAPAVPVARPAAGGSVTGTPAVRRRAPGRCGHAPDYTWLQGMLRRHDDGRVELQFADETGADRLGGVVLLDSDRPLDAFADGAAVVVEGDLILATGRPAAYRVRTVARVGPDS